MRTARGHSCLEPSGLTLIEVVAATAVLLLGVAATTGLFVRASRMSRQDAAADRVRALCRGTAESLIALPFRAAPGDPDLLAAVFPHADPVRNTTGERFVVAGEQDVAPGSFVIERWDAGARTRTVATFVRLSGLSFQSLPVDEVIGWSGAEGDPAPSACLRVSVSVFDGEASDGTCVLATADRDLRRRLGGRP
jgi:hypothetical protein